MRPGGRTLRAAVVAGIAAGGVTLGHVLGYMISVPQAAARHALLVETGHAYAPTAGFFAGAVAILACATALGIGLARGMGHERGAPTVRWAMTRTAFLQAVAFILLESAERILAGAPLGALIGVHLGVGLLVQIAVGAAAGFVLVALDRAGEVIARAIPRARARARRVLELDIQADHTMRSRWLDSARPIRGPPVLLGL